MSDKSSQILPSSPESEKCLLSCLLDPEYTATVLSTGVKPDFFHDLANRMLFNVICEVFTQHKVVSVQAVHELATTEAVYKGDYPGLQYLMEVSEYCPSAVEYPIYVATLKKYKDARTAATLAHRIRAIQGKTLSIDEINAEVSEAVTTFQTEIVGEVDGSLHEPFDEWIGELENYRRGVAMTLGIPTGFSYLDKVISGVHEGENMIIAARPGWGKTALALNLCENIAIKERVPTLLISMEMRVPRLIERLCCSMSRVNMQKFRTGFAEEVDFEKLALMREHIVDSPLYMVYRAKCTDLEFENLVSYFVAKKGVRVVVTDYLQLLKPSKEGRSKEEDVAKVNGTVTRVIRQLNVAGITLAQMNRDKEKEVNRLPRLSDLRGSGEIEQDADCVAFIHPLPEEKKNQDDEDEGEKEKPKDAWEDVRKKVQIVIAKQRNGPLGVSNMIFYKSCIRMEECDMHDDPAHTNVSFSPYLPDEYGQFGKGKVDFSDVPPL